MPIQYPYTSAMQQAGILPYQLSGMGVAGTILSGLPQAFLSGLDVARALKHEEWQRQQYEQQMKYTQGANLLNMIFDALARVGDVEQVKKTVPEQHKKLILETVGINVDEMLSSIPKIENLLPQADYSIVGEKTKNLGYWLGGYYTTLPGTAVKELFGEKITTPEGREIKVDPNRLYVLPSGYQQLWTRKQQMELNKARLFQQLYFNRNKLATDEKLKAIKTALDFARRNLETGNIKGTQDLLSQALFSLNEVYKEKVGMPLVFDTSILDVEERGFLEEIIDTISTALGFKEVTKETKSITPKTEKTTPKQIAPGVTVK